MRSKSRCAPATSLSIWASASRRAKVRPDFPRSAYVRTTEYPCLSAYCRIAFCCAGIEYSCRSRDIRTYSAARVCGSLLSAVLITMAFSSARCYSALIIASLCVGIWRKRTSSLKGGGYGESTSPRRQRALRHGRRGDDSIRRPARPLFAGGAGWRGRRAPFLGQSLLLSALQRPCRSRDLEAAEARGRRRAAFTAHARRFLAVPRAPECRARALRQSRHAARLCARCGRLILRLQDAAREGPAARRPALPDIDPDGQQRRARALFPRSERRRTHPPRLRGSARRRARCHRETHPRQRSRDPMGHGLGDPSRLRRCFNPTRSKSRDTYRAGRAAIE